MQAMTLSDKQKGQAVEALSVFEGAAQRLVLDLRAIRDGIVQGIARADLQQLVLQSRDRFEASLEQVRLDFGAAG